MKELPKINPKLVVSEYYDSLINRIDIHTEEQLAKFSDSDVVENAKTTKTETTAHVNDNEDDETSTQKQKPNYKYECEPTIRVVPGETRVCEYLNGVREELMKHLKEAQTEAFKLLDMIKNDHPNAKEKSDDMSASTESVLRRSLPNRYPFIIQINEFVNESRDRVKLLNSSPFKLCLIEMDFFVSQEDMLYLR